MVAKPSVLATASNLALFATVCVFACHLHGWQQLKKVSFRSSRRSKSVLEDAGERKKLIVISGCDRGFGRLLAVKLLECSEYLVLALNLSEQSVKELEDLNSSSTKGKIFAIRCDVTSDQDIQEMKEYAETILQSHQAVLYCIVNNAGVVGTGDFVFFHNIETHKRVMDVNYFGQLRVTQALLPLMLRTSRTLLEGARIINMSSVCGTSASPLNSSYCASKFAVEAWSDSLRLELQPFNITVVKVRPGQIDTDIQKDYFNVSLKNYLAAPRQIRELYGGNAFHDLVKAVSESMKSLKLPGPMTVVDALTDIMATSEEKLQPHYWIGQDAHTLWRALSSLPTTVSDSMKRQFLFFRPLKQTLPPLGVISHVTIRVRELEKSLPFYKAFGLKPLGDTENGQQFLCYGEATESAWPTLVLLREDPSMPARGESSDAGMTRLCIYTASIDAEIRRLSELGLESIAGPAESKVAKGVAYKDPDGFVVYLIQFNGPIGLIIRASQWWYKMQPGPSLFHWTINVTDALVGMKVFEKLGFQTLSDQNKDQILSDLLPAFNMDPKTTVIEHIRLCKLPKDFFIATIMQWVNPKSELKGSELTNSMTLSVRDVETALEKARQAGMTTEAPEYRQLPMFGGVLIGVAYVEPGCNRIEFCNFRYKQ